MVNNLSYLNQFGFRPDRSYTIALECVVHEILKEFKEKLILGSTLIDLTKAFDVALTSILFTMLNYYKAI